MPSFLAIVHYQDAVFVIDAENEQRAAEKAEALANYGIELNGIEIYERPNESLDDF